MPTPHTVAALARVVLALAAVVALAACEGRSPAFLGTDITGANYGRGFSLLDPDGKVRTLADFHGKVVMLFFGFTQCPDICPTALTRAAEVRRLLGADGDRLQVLFVTVDPERDTPEVLRTYVTAFDAANLGLYASLDDTRRVAEDFRVFYRKVPTGSSYTMDHTATSYVFDPEGRLRLAVGYQASAEQVAADLITLLHSTSAQ